MEIGPDAFGRDDSASLLPSLAELLDSINSTQRLGAIS